MELESIEDHLDEYLDDQSFDEFVAELTLNEVEELWYRAFCESDPHAESCYFSDPLSGGSGRDDGNDDFDFDGLDPYPFGLTAARIPRMRRNRLALSA